MDGLQRRPIGFTKAATYFFTLLVLSALLAIPIPTPAQDSSAKSPDKPAPTVPLGAEINKILPTWLNFSGEYRIRPEDHTAYNFVSGANDGFVLSRLRLNVEATPVSWFLIFVQAQDAEAMGIETSHVTSSIKDVFDLRQAYLEFHNKPGGWVRVRVGRQELRFGAERLVGVSDWTNVTRVFDAARVTLGTPTAHVDFFTSAVVVDHPTSFDAHPGGLTFHGIYGSLSHVVPKATVEPYVYWKALPVVKSEEGLSGTESLFTYGFRLIGKLPSGFDFAIEAARQGGHLSTDSIAAWGGYGILGYTPARMFLKPRFSMQYDFASGDKKLKDGVAGTFDQLYPSNHDVFGLLDLLGWRNIRQFRAGVEAKPFAKLTLKFNYRDLHLATRHDALYGSTGTVIVKAPVGGALSTSIGNEADISFTSDIRKDIGIGAGYGHLFLGQFLIQNSPGSSTSIAYSFVTIKF